ncbi:TolB family protein [Cryobacterium roopkundense]|uniref:TolB-like translocation protein n=1 Tax=Cryobacterium roopkundense TaxID=1001240 RepID=A0A7W8ZYW9_9MICO|nr:PD40 domain-containing protein [Cryobacterium roopkundense]MBB5642768.1 hypothetical protein [Cryobacterium roopkundense]
MSTVLIGVVALTALGSAFAYAGWSSTAVRTGPAALAEAPVGTRTIPIEGSRIVFRHTELGSDYGLIAAVPWADSGGPRKLSDVSCERVYAADASEICLRLNRNDHTTFTADLLDQAGQLVRSWPLPGVPSRARINADGTLVAFSAFITAEAYATVGFSIATVIAEIGGPESVNLETFALSVGGVAVTAADRNLWGVTFTSDPNVFYATAASEGQTWLVRGNRAAATLTAISEGAECPSVSPDGTRIAYKKNMSGTTAPLWNIAVLDLATNEETLLPDARNIDDQVEWLDNSTILYGIVRADSIGDSDIWSAPVDGSADARLEIEHGWSPSVVRE